MRTILSALFLATVCTAAAAQQPPTRRQIEASAGAPWTHQRSGVVLPMRIGDYPRQGIVENTPGEVDVLAQYEDEATRVTVILFRPQQNDVGFWFDRAEIVLPLNPLLGSVAASTDQPIAFASSISPTPSALRRSYSSTGRWKATGTALIPAGRWLVKVRASSSSLDAAAIDRLIDAAIAAIRLPADAQASPAARVIMPCAESIVWQQATAIVPTDSSALEASLGAVVTSGARGTAAVTDGFGLADPSLCRDATTLEFGSVYRAPLDPKRYWIGYSDSGDVAVVGPASQSDTDVQAGLFVATPVESLLFPGFDSLPAPSQALAALTSGRSLASASFDPEAPSGEAVQFTIFSD